LDLADPGTRSGCALAWFRLHRGPSSVVRGEAAKMELGGGGDAARDGRRGRDQRALACRVTESPASRGARARQRGEIPISGRRARTWRDLPGDGRPPARPPPRTARLRRWGPSPRPPGLDGAMQPRQRWCFYFDGATGCCSAAAFGLGSSKQCTKRQVHHMHARAQAEAGGSAGHVARGVSS